ncbi:MAG: 16S rRNA (cytosine(967)-C(5))-methyltransferase RsmB [Deltaproteobacteria bacterium]|jgi:16S rRNA (cytosine967-C5)-methyltransferase|nr:16S rRNA (cytosine(967)-C(5))-methyltransferase RsmB [Deltaproteobacteria bacterium]MBT6433891.1 16S rRNA (cytosine(967)-C(5))-methyltransferase RsmB [Deltaproteobacteria bacterium]MBT6489510.1 16S rRNA (cytosine(967)-C(5))-methyltransferase RsmB [Deltaproteobacteria bacterium]
MTTSVSRAIAHRVLLRTEEDAAYARHALDAAIKRARPDSRDAGLATELVYGVLRTGHSLDYIIQSFLPRPLKRVTPSARAALRLGAYEILNLRTPDYSAVDQAVSLLDSKKLRGFVNGVLRNLVRLKEQEKVPEPLKEIKDPVQAQAVHYGLPLWMMKLLHTELGPEEANLWAEANSHPAPLNIRVNTHVSSRDELLTQLQEAEIAAVALPLFPDALELAPAGSIAALPGFADGAFIVQDPAAQLVGYLVSPQEGQNILDLCAAPGGKSLHLAQMLEHTGKVVAVDVHQHKMNLIQDNANRLGLKNVIPQFSDATQLASMKKVLERTKIEHVDHIVLDAPCSGLGTLRRHPELRYKEDARIQELCELQDALLLTASQLMGPGSTLTYSLCTMTQAEGIARIEKLIGNDSSLQAVPLTNPVLAPFVSDSKLGEKTVLQTLTHKHGADSFFAMQLRKKP